MKTLQIGLGWLPEQTSGLNRFFYDSARYLSQVGVETDGIVAGSPSVTQNSGGRICAFAPHESSLWRRWWSLRQTIQHLLGEREYSLIASHFALYTFPVLDQVEQYPLVMHFHGSWALEGSAQGENFIAVRFKRMLEQMTYNRATGFIVLSQASRDILHREYCIPLERIHIVPGGVDTERFDTGLTQREARQKLGWPEDRPIVLTVSRLMRRKGLENLIQALRKVRCSYPDVLLLIAGKGPQEIALQKMIGEYGLNEHVRLLGTLYDPQLGWAYRAADFSVVPSLALEGFGLIIVESLATGTPVIATPVGGIPGILRPFSADLLMEGNTTEDITQGMLEVLSGQRRLPSSDDCITFVQEHYAWPVIAAQIKSVYQAILEDRNL